MTLRLIAIAISSVCLAFGQGPLRFELKRFEKKTTSCHVILEYPEITSAASPEARDRINAGILKLLLRQNSWPASDSGSRSLEGYVSSFLNECAAEQDRPEHHPLYMRKFVTIFRYTPPILSFKCEADEDSGGAHPFGTILFINFETSTGQTIALPDVLKEGAFPKLQSLAEGIFRRENKLSPRESLSEHDYTFPEDRFKLNDNFGFGENALVFLFNTYEIGPGAMPGTQVTIDYPFLRELLKPGLDLERWQSDKQVVGK
jgi:Protein of unknown function (DUF3298)